MTHIRPCAEADLTPEDFELLEQAVLQGDAMDAQIIEVFKNFPKKFHVAMLPDVRASMKDEIEEQAAEADIATNELWQSKLKRFQADLNIDQALLRTTERGSRRLADLIEWFELEAKRALAHQAKKNWSL